MPLPRWLARINRRVFNPREVKRGQWPVLTHVGRTSGTVYRTPLEAHPIEGGYLFVLMYGARSDWARNVLAAGEARLTVDDRELALTNPRLIPREAARALVPDAVKLPQRLFRVSEFLQMDLAG